MLSADFGHLDRDTRMIDRSAAQWIHIDVMDGVFVPNISFGFPVMKAIKSASSKFMDVHLMIVHPERYVERFRQAGADLITFHQEAADDPQAIIETIRRGGAKAGISIKPATPVKAIEALLPMLDLVLVMSVRELRRMIDRAGLETMIEIDGGVSASNAGMLYEAGCDALVAGSAVFRSADPEAEILKILNA